MPNKVCSSSKHKPEIAWTLIFSIAWRSPARVEYCKISANRFSRQLSRWSSCCVTLLSNFACELCKFRTANYWALNGYNLERKFSILVQFLPSRHWYQFFNISFIQRRRFGWEWVGKISSIALRVELYIVYAFGKFEHAGEFTLQ